MNNRIIPFAEITAGDRRLAAFRGLTTDALQEWLVEMRLSPAIPARVRHHLLQAKRCCLAGWFFYELFEQGAHAGITACEAALQERYVADLPLPCTLVARRRAARTAPLVVTERPDVKTFMQRLYRDWALESDLSFLGSFAQLIDWARARGLIREADHERWEALLMLRNNVAHGAAMVVPPHMPLRTLERIVRNINRLFPDPATAAYDELRERAADDFNGAAGRGTPPGDPANGGTDIAFVTETKRSSSVPACAPTARILST